MIIGGHGQNVVEADKRCLIENYRELEYFYLRKL